MGRFRRPDFYCEKVLYQKRKVPLSFKTENDEVVEIRGAEGLNYKIEEV